MDITPDTIVYWQAGPIRAECHPGVHLAGDGVHGPEVLASDTPPIHRDQSAARTKLARISGGQYPGTDPGRHTARSEPLPAIHRHALPVHCRVQHLAIVPGFQPPTGSLSTTAALALSVFVAVPVYGIAACGLAGYLKNYIRPSVFMLPFNVIGDLSRTLALAMRLFGNVMSGTMIAAMLLAIAPFLFPILMHALGLLTGLIQAYIFAVLALVYIAAAAKVHELRKRNRPVRQTERREIQWIMWD